MGLTLNSTGRSVSSKKSYKRERPSDIVVALSGNPNVGKSTLFNALTGLRQHTGNWTGKTVETACGAFIHNGRKIILVDLPGSYSLVSHSEEERVAEDYIVFGNYDINVVVCDAAVLERNLNLLLQITEITPKTLLCVNLVDEAEKKGIIIDTDTLSARLKIPVIATAARSGKGIQEICDAIVSYADSPPHAAVIPEYDEETEKAIKDICAVLPESLSVNRRFAAIKILENDEHFLKEYRRIYNLDLSEYVPNSTLPPERIVGGIMSTVKAILNNCIKQNNKKRKITDLKIDRIITSKLFSVPIMLLLLGIIFWLTISGANYPSQLLSRFFTGLEQPLYHLLLKINLPDGICQMLTFGVYRVVTWIVSVMLPPMAIFFPLFTLLEDLGLLPRIAFNLDKCFQKCRTCGKQALTMCMGFGCNAAGVVGCRIIDSPRERLIAILTNSLVPCNGRFPTLITLIAIFFVGTGGILSELGATALLCLFVLISIFMTFFASFILSRTLLRGVPSSFTLELPSYRKPQILKVIIRSMLDRTLFVLGRAVLAAIPAGFIIWLAANTYIGDNSLLTIAANLLNPIGLFLGLDGVILLAFILGLPANEIVIPIIIMAYSRLGTLTDTGDINFIKTLFIDNDWTTLTALNVIIFSLFHWPCATTLLTIKKETGSIKWSVLAAVIPTLIGITLCAVLNSIFD